MRTLHVGTAMLATLAAAAVAQGAPRLRDVVLEGGDVFTDAEAAGNLFYGFANLLHVVTDEQVIRREVWFRRGDRVTPDEAAELERNLREFGLFGEVHTELRPVGPDEQDLIVRTRDRFSLSVNASVARVGGVQKYTAGLSESNLLGSGKTLAVSASRSQDERQQFVSWVDPQFLGSWQTLALQTGSTDEGNFTNVSLRRPFHHLDDPYTWGADLAISKQRVDYFRRGDSTAEVPLDFDGLRLFAAAGSGPRELRQALGLDLRLHRQDYSPAIGPDAGRVRVPGDTDDIELGPYWTIDDRPRFDEVRRLDAFDFDEDLTLGVHAGARLAGRYRDEQGAGSALQPLLDVEFNAACTPLPHAYLTLATNAVGRLDGDSLAGWRTSAALHAYLLDLPAQTLAGSVTFDAVEEEQDLQPQLTLGEDDGLRGYPAREFAGTRRWRLNLEDRADTGIEILSVHVGVTGFFDVGWINDRDSSLTLGDAIRGVGAGLRLGSSHLFGSRVMRIDVAWPLDDVGGRQYGVSLSFAVGQVFTFFGNANVLGSQF